MTVSDEDRAQQIEKDRKLALELQVQENVLFARAQRQEGVVTTEEQQATPPHIGDELSFAVIGEEGSDEDSSSSTFDRRVAAMESTGEYQEEYFDDSDSFDSRNSSDMSSGVLVPEESSSPPLTTSQDTKSPGERSPDIPSSYALAAATAPSPDSEPIADGLISPIAHSHHDSAANKEPATEVAPQTQARRTNRNEYYYDIRHVQNGDKIFQALLGEYGKIDTLRIKIKLEHKKNLATNSKRRMAAAKDLVLEAPADNPKQQLERYTLGITKPHYQRLGLTGPIRDRVFKTAVQHSLWDHATVFIGKGKTELESEQEAARKAVASLLTSAQAAERASHLTISFRAAAAKLPFALRFQLERSILSDAPERIPLKMKRCPKADGESAKKRLMYSARAMMLIYIHEVLPPLLKINWVEQCDGEDCYTLIELFAEEMWDVIIEIKQAIKTENKVVFSQDKVQEILCRARDSLHHAESVGETTEAELGYSGGEGCTYVETIQKRSFWPVGMYSCKFDFDGSLVPTDFQVVNKNIANDKHVEPQTRRALREAGWPVRDRFVIMSSVKFHCIFQERLGDWLAENPKMCHREYEFLFDKGTGKPTIWLYAPPKEGAHVGLTRNSLLESLGYFRDVAATKLGDRISLAFTQTTPIDEIPLDCIVAEPELVGNNYKFSDGCGVMGPGIARKVQQVLRLPEVPGAIQIRMGGVKGMLSYRHDYPANKIGIRPSMVKFRSNHRMLEVKQHAYVNGHPPIFSQLILVMHHLNVSNQVLLGLQAKACAEMARKFDVGAGKVTDDFKYSRKVVKHGRKEDGRHFSATEFDELRRTMVEAKRKVNLRCSVILVYGVIDEYGVLEEGQVLVCNGAIEGSVLISRSPCLMPGDIQKAYAVTGRGQNDEFFQAYSKLRDVIVFSSKGRRPLADCLGGGDLDGDQFYVIDEKDLVAQVKSTEAHDYESQKLDVQITIDVQVCFHVEDAQAPAIENQLNVLRKLLILGDVVGKTSDAWLRVADFEGPGSACAMNMADLCQRALDARRLAFQIDDEQFRMMELIRKEYEAPHWRSSRENSRISNSILGILYNIWDSWIRDLEATSRRRLRGSQGYRGIEATGTFNESDSQMETDTVLSTETQCIICFAKGNMQCDICGGTVWVCGEQCRIWHEGEAGHTRGSTEARRQTNTIEPSQMSGDSCSMMARPMRVLLDVVFGRERPSCNGATTIDFRCLNGDDLRNLREMVLTEFYHSMMQSKHGYRSKESTTNAPRSNDVFLMEDGELSVCRRPHADGDLMWFDQHDNPTGMHSGRPIRRVASLSGVLRILESLMSIPAAGSLMEQAMKRDLVAVTATTETIAFDTSNVGYLNESQRQVVETTLSMKNGIFAVQGPPGCGKSSTIVEIIVSVGRGVIVTAPSNAAVADLARKILSTGRFEAREVVVWGENCEDSVRFLNPVHRHNKVDDFRKRYKRAQNKKDEEEMDKLKRDLASWLHLDGATIHKMEATARLRRSDLRQGLAEAASAKILLCTLNTSGSTPLRNAVKYKYDLMLLDEGGQAPEAEFYIATTFPGVRRIVIVGDPRQLPATVSHEGCQEAGYADSFIAHVLEYKPEKVHLLDVQYRMAPEILAFSNKMFYSGRVQSDESVLRREPRVQSPFSIVDTSGFGRGVEQRVYSSWKNECEANVIKSILCNDEDVRLVQSKVKNARTIVITPYKAQERFLREELKKIKSLRPWDISTVDNFQGQDGDIVIVSTVRTSAVGFTDNPNRLNVALTRPKRVLRVVGNMDFFKDIPDSQSTLRRLAAFAERKGIVKATIVSSAFKSPDWSEKKAWKPTMTARFHDCLKTNNMKRVDKNVAFNTLLAISASRLSDLTSSPTEDGPRWQCSSLRKQSVHVVWIAKELEELEHQDVALADACFKGVVEAHFAGKRRECLTFMQKNHLVPRNSCRIKRDMSVIIPGENQAAKHSTDVEVSWEITNDIQNAIVDEYIEELPLGLFLLDKYQERILSLAPPLLIESRSGTGKTEILFKHSISYYPPGQAYRTCFLTVSANLCRTLQRRYYDVQEAKQVVLPRVSFFSFLGSRVQRERESERVRSLVTDLLGIYRIPEAEMSVSSSCSFWDYVKSKTSHKKLELDLILAENEIGGVILGSLAVAVKKTPLSRGEYMSEKRSNIPNDADGETTKKRIYDEFENYQMWKVETGKYDTSDIVLRLICETSKHGTREMFQSVYLDEVQDFSYASLYLVCSIAGKTEGRWVAAGDTAQMISPGCSFTFKGFKDTLNEIRRDIKLKKVETLKRNYRMNRGTLEMANRVITVIKTYFPGAIESYQEEEAMKDLSLKVALLDWEDALKEKPSFGLNQAVIYASDVNLDGVRQSVEKWPEHEHPFILSSLDSKGLEYDDVIVAFDFSRKTWGVGGGRTASLRMYRELYVAVTRARRRVVILVKKVVNTMPKFFEHLGYTFEQADPDIIIREFQKQTTVDEWFERGMELLNEERYKIAASCFKAAQDFGWSSYADGLHLLLTHDFQEARNLLRTSAELFFQDGQFEQCLDAFTRIAGLEGPWLEADSEILDAALLELPDYLPREKTVLFALRRQSWNVISSGDLISYSHLFRDSRGDSNLTKIVEKCTESERYEIEKRLPLVVGDYHVMQGRFAEATSLFLVGGDYHNATGSTEAAIRQSSGDLPRIANLWRQDENARRDLPVDPAISLLVSLFERPKEAAMNHANECMRSLGPSVVKLAINSAEDAGAEELHLFSRIAFKAEILLALKERYREDLFNIVHWYHERNDTEGAVAYAASRLTDSSGKATLAWKDADIRGILAKLTKRNVDILAGLIKHFLSEKAFALKFAKAASDEALASVSKNEVEIMKVWRMWNSRLQDNRVSQFPKQDASSSSTALLCLMFVDPESAGWQHGKKCVQLFGKEVVRNAVLKKKDFDKQRAYTVLCTFDKTMFASDKPAHPKIRESSTAKGRGLANSQLGAQVNNKTSMYSYLAGLDSNEEEATALPLNETRFERMPFPRTGTGQSRPFERNTAYSSDDSNLSSLEPRKQRSRKTKEPQHQQAADSDSSSMPSLVHKANQDSSNDDSAAQQAADSDDSSIPPLAQQAYHSSPDDDGTAQQVGTSESDGSEGMPEIFAMDQRPAARVREQAGVPSGVYTTQTNGDNRSDDDNDGDSLPPPLQERGGSGSGSASTDDDIPALLIPQSSSDESVPPLQDRASSRSSSDSDRADVMERDRANRQALLQSALASRWTQSEEQPMPPRNASGPRKKKGKGRRGKGGRRKR